MRASKFLHSSLFALVIAVGSVSARGDVLYTYNLDSTGSFGSGPYGTVLLHQDGTSVDFTVTLASNLQFVDTGGPHSALSFNATGVSPADVTNVEFNGVSAATLGFTVSVADTSPPVTNGNSPYGSTFSLNIDCTASSPLCPNGAPGAVLGPLTFVVANATYGDFGFLATGTTAFFASDVICTRTTGTSGCTNGATGAIGVTGPGDKIPPDQIPEPATLALVSLGLIGVGLARRRRAR